MLFKISATEYVKNIIRQFSYNLLKLINCGKVLFAIDENKKAGLDRRSMKKKAQ